MDTLIEEVVTLEPIQRMKVSIKSATKYGTLVGASTIISGIIGGPLGLTVGGVISSCVAGYLSQGTLQSVPYILCYETTPEQKQKLSKAIHSLLKSKHIMAISDVLLSIQNNKQLEEAIIQMIIMFLSSEMGYKGYDIIRN